VENLQEVGEGVLRCYVKSWALIIYWVDVGNCILDGMAMLLRGIGGIDVLD